MFAYAGKEEVVYHNKGGRPSGPIKTACPLLREFFEIADERKITQLALSKGIKVWPKTINDWRNGRSIPDVFLYQDFAKFLAVKITIQR